jgi:hypothetical protein
LLASELGWELPDDHRIITPEAVLAVVPSWVDDLPTEKETDN